MHHIWLMIPPRGSVSNFVDRLQQQGRYGFAFAELAATVPAARPALNAAVRRLVSKGRLRRVTPQGDFLVIVPHEYHTLGAPPVAWVLDAYLRHLGVSYYVALLSAAEWHGSAHFAVQEMQVVVSEQLRPISLGRERVRFFVKQTAAATPVENRATDAGSVRVSTPEATLLDLIRYRHAAGGLSRAATIVKDLGNRCQAAGLRAALETADDPPSAQRLGYLLERLGFKTLAGTVRSWISRHRHSVCALEPSLPADGPRREPWDVIENAAVEVTA